MFSSTRTIGNMQEEPEFSLWLMQGVMAHHKEIVDYFNSRNVSIIFLFRRNLLRRMVSVLANSYDRDARVLNGTHKSHVHSTDEVCSDILPLSHSHSFSLFPSPSHTNSYFCFLTLADNVCRLICFQNSNLQSMPQL